MIIYFASRMLNILGLASTSHNSKYVVVEDSKQEDAQTGIGSFEFKVAFDDDSRQQLENMIRVGNCVLRAETAGDGSRTSSDRYTIDGSHDFFTITETEIDVQAKTIYAYAEDAGLDLINDLAPAKEYSAAADIETYIDDFASNSGFEVRRNEIPTVTKQLSWDSESTVSERLQDIAENFGCDISFAFDVQGLSVSAKYIDVTESSGTGTDVILYMDKDISNITVKESINNLATALYATGKDDLTLSGYTYDDGDFYVNGKYLYSRNALENWQRYAWKSDFSGDVYKTYSCEASTKLRLCEMAIEELKALREPEVNYEVEIRKLDAAINIRDRLSIVDDKGELYLSAKVLQLETSITAGTKTATLGDYIMQDSGISDKVIQLASSFSELSKSRYVWVAYADDASGAGISTEPDGKAYMGTAYGQKSETVDISDPSVFKWVKTKGEKGDDGDAGTGVQSVTQYYLLSETVPEQPSTTWATTEPAYDPETDSGKTLYFANLTTLSDGSSSWSDVSVSSSYEASKSARIKADIAQETADAVQEDVDSLGEVVSGKEDDENDKGLAGDLVNLKESLYGTDEVIGDIDQLTDATNELSEATAALKVVQEDTSNRLSDSETELEKYRGSITIDTEEPSITIGAGTDTNLKITPDKMQFMDNGNEAASLSNDRLKANSTEITNLYMRSVDSSGNTVGTLGWVARSNGHLSLKVIG